MLVTISGASGSGKTSLVRRITREFDNYCELISCTSRAPRKREIEGVDYYFKSKEYFDDRSKFFEIIEFNNHYYAMLQEEIVKCREYDYSFVILNREGVERFKAKQEQIGTDILSVYIDIDPKLALYRLTSRDGKEHALARYRYDLDNNMYDSSGYDCVIPNDSNNTKLMIRLLNAIKK